MTRIIQVKKKSQITIPREIREKLEIEEGDLLEADVEDDAVVLRPRPSDKIHVHTVSADNLQRLAGIVSVGGDAVQDSERAFEE